MMWIFRKNKDHIGLETLSEYLDGRLGASQAQELEGHLEACSMCVQELESLRETVGLLRQVPMLEPRRIFTLGGAPSRAPARPLFRVPTWAYGAAASVAVLFFALVTTADLGGLLAGDPASQDGSNLASEARVQATPQAQPTQVASQPVPAPSVRAPQELAAQAPEPTLVPEDAKVAQESVPVAPLVVQKSEVSDQTIAGAAETAPPALGEPETEPAALAPKAPDTSTQEKGVENPVAGSDATAVLPAPPVPAPVGTPEIRPPQPTVAPKLEQVERLEPQATPTAVAAPTRVPTAMSTPSSAIAGSTPPRAGTVAPDEAEATPTRVATPTSTPASAIVPTPLPAATEAPASADEAAPESLVPAAAVADGGTSILWHVLEGVLAAAALALGGALLWRSRRFGGGRAA